MLSLDVIIHFKGIFMEYIHGIHIFMEKIYCKYKKFKVPIIYTIFYNYLVLIILDIDTIIYDEIIKLQRKIIFFVTT